MYFLVEPFVYFHTSCVLKVKDLARLCSLPWALAGRLSLKWSPMRCVAGSFQAISELVSPCNWGAILEAPAHRDLLSNDNPNYLFVFHSSLTRLISGQEINMGRVKQICVFEHSVMINFNCAWPAIQRGQGSGFLSEGSSWLTAFMSEQWRFWRDCADAQARLNLRCSHRR